MREIEKSPSYDIVIVGGGTGGYVAAIRAAQHGKKVAVVEKQQLGGTCLHRGCIPAKTLLESSKLYHQIQHANRFGIYVEPEHIRYDAAMVFERKETIVKQLEQGIQYLLKKNKVEIIRGEGRLAGKTDDLFHLQVHTDPSDSPQSLYAEKLILATGSTPKRPAGIPFDGVKLLTSDEIVAKPFVPDHITIVGAGAIGVEFASYFNDLGSSVHLIEGSDHLVPLEDEEISIELRCVFEKKGIHISTGCMLLSDQIQHLENGKLEYTLKNREGSYEKQRTHAILFAVGRKNNIDGLGLSTLGLDEGGPSIPVNEYMETSVPGLYAIGDITGTYQLAHVASQQAIIASDHICGKETLPYQSNRVPRCTYTHPEISSVGLTEKQAKQEGFTVKVGKFPLKPNGRSIIHGETEGFVKLVVDADNDLILGAHMIGNGATELISTPSLAIFLEGTAWELSMNVYPHPTVSEIFGEAAHAVEGHAIHM